MCNNSYDIDAITPTTVNSPGVFFCLLCFWFRWNQKKHGTRTTGFTNQAAQGKGGGG